MIFMALVPTFLSPGSNLQRTPRGIEIYSRLVIRETAIPWYGEKLRGESLKVQLKTVDSDQEYDQKRHVGCCRVGRQHAPF